jgi:hypothetical protein
VPEKANIRRYARGKDGRTNVATTCQQKLNRLNPSTNPIPNRQRTRARIIELTRESLSVNPVPIIEETTSMKKVPKQKNKTRRGHRQVSSEDAISFQSPSGIK